MLAKPSPHALFLRVNHPQLFPLNGYIIPIKEMHLPSERVFVSFVHAFLMDSYPFQRPFLSDSYLLSQLRVPSTELNGLNRVILGGCVCFGPPRYEGLSSVHLEKEHLVLKKRSS